MSVKQLQLFNRRARYLAESRFIKWLDTRGNKQPDMARLLSGDWLAFEGLHREDLDSFCLNLRLLIQDRDGFSIKCLSKIYEQFPDDYDIAKKAFIHVRSNLNEYLAQTSLVQLDRQNPLSHKDLLDIILYGGIAHNDSRHYDNFVKMTQAGIFSLFTFTTLWNIVKVINKNIQKIALLNSEVMSWETESK